MLYLNPKGRVVAAVQALHRAAVLRYLAKRVCRNWTIAQPFHGGVICLDAVEHSWAWTGEWRYETFDAPLQTRLLALSLTRDLFVDIGCNIGAMTLSVLLRNPRIRALCVDPNARAVALLRKSLRKNGLTQRASVVQAAVARCDGWLPFDQTESVTGHVAETGQLVSSIGFGSYLNRVCGSRRSLVKIDIEGFEAVVLDQIGDIAGRSVSCFVIELHPAGFNGFGDPARCVRCLLDAGARIEDLQGEPLGSVDEAAITQVVATFAA